MAYCVKCGVKLGDSEKKCPLCQTIVYHPDLPPVVNAKTPFPKEHEAEMKKMSLRFKLLIATLIVLLPTVLTVICDYSINSRMVWSGFVVSSVCLVYCLIFIPLFFQIRSVLIYLIIDFLSILLFQWYIAYSTGGTWFVVFSLPATCSVTLIVAAAMIFKRFTKASSLFISAVVFLLAGLDSVLIELLINKTFMNQVNFIWSYYPFVTFVVVGLILFLCDRNQRLKEKLTKKFFI